MTFENFGNGDPNPDQELDSDPKGRGRNKPQYVLRLYVAGLTPASRRAILNIEKICSEHLEGNYDLEIVDVHQDTTLAKRERLIAAPTLLRKLPLPLKRLVGDLSNTETVLLGLDLP